MSYLINRYIFKELAAPFVISVGILTAIFLLTSIPKLIGLVVNYGVENLVVLKFILFITPSFLIYTIPISFLISVIITYSRLSADSEIIAMKASGLSISRISSPVILMALLTYIISSFFTIYAFPWGNISSRRLIYDIARSKATIGLRERVFNDAFDGLMLYVTHIKPESGQMEGIFLSDRRDGKNNNIIVAKKGVISSEQQTMKVIMRLFNGAIHRSENKELYEIVTFNTYDLILNLKEGKVKNPGTSKTNKDLTVKQLKRRIADIKREGRDTAPYIIDLHKRFALPASVFVFGLLGIPLGIQRVRTTRFTGFGIGLGIVLVYYLLATALESLGEKGLLNPILAVWGTDVVMGISAIYLFYRETKDKPPRPIIWLRVMA